MPVDQHSFIIPEDQNISALVWSLQNTFSIRVQNETVYHKTFYDTFDWRLTRNGSILEVDDDNPSPRIYWQGDKAGKLKIQLGLRKVPHLAGDLPAGEFRQQLRSVISVRELLPRIKVRVKRQSLVVLDENEKIVVRLYLDVYWYSPSKLRAARVLTRRLTIKALKGYAEDYRRVDSFFVDMQLPIPLQPAQNNVVKLALIASGARTNDYSTNLKLRLDPFMPDEQVLKIILLRLLEILQQNTAGSIKGRDTEFMHDYCVALTKIRIVLKQLDQHYPQAVGTEYKHFFSKLGKLTDPVRVLDVFLMQLEDYQPDYEKAGWQHLQPLRDYLLLSRTEAGNSLNETLKSSQYRKTIKQWRDYLKQSEDENGEANKAGQPVYKLTNELICDINQQILAKGKTIAKSADAEALYDLRKTFKQLRYLIELFSSLYPAIELRAIIQTLTDVQDKLEIFDDRHIQLGVVQAFIQQSKNEVAIQSAEKILEILEQQKNEAYKNIKDRYKKYALSGSQKKFKELFVDYHQGKMKL